MAIEIHRREFLSLTTMGGLGSLLLSNGLAGCITNAMSTKGKIALQLYTLRNEMERDARGTLERLSEIGFENVETAFWPSHISIKEGGRLLTDAGLSVCSAHCSLPFGDKKSEMLEIADVFRCTRMIWHGWPEDDRYKTNEGIHQLAEMYNEANHIAKSNGLEFGLHNHWWEFKNKVDERFAFEVLLDLLDEDIFFEIDTYWVKVAGHDPATIVGSFGKRAPLLHIKDGPAKWTDTIATSPEPMVAVGQGTQDFPGIVNAANGNTQWMIVEMDVCASDIFSAIKESHVYLTEKRLAEG
jgi:sugar phosphate isomerase/epimerase